MNKFRLGRVAERFVREREKTSHTFGRLYNKVDKAVEVRMLCRTSNSGVVQVSLEANKRICSQERMGPARYIYIYIYTFKYIYIYVYFCYEADVKADVPNIRHMSPCNERT